MDATTITIGSLFGFVAIVITVATFLAKSKREIQMRASNYAVLTSQVLHLEQSNEDLKQEIKEHKAESKAEFRRMEEMISVKLTAIDAKIDDLLKLFLSSKK